MTRFNEIVINKDEGTVDIGAGLTWTGVYQYLEARGLNVVGGRLNGVGIAGFTLGGGQCHSALAHIGPYSNSVLSSLGCGRIFLEDQPIWTYHRHRYGI